MSLIKKKKYLSFCLKTNKQTQKHDTSAPEEVKSQVANKKKPLLIIKKMISIFTITTAKVARSVISMIIS